MGYCRLLETGQIIASELKNIPRRIKEWPGGRKANPDKQVHSLPLSSSMPSDWAQSCALCLAPLKKTFFR